MCKTDGGPIWGRDEESLGDCTLDEIEQCIIVQTRDPPPHIERDLVARNRRNSEQIALSLIKP